MGKTSIEWTDFTFNAWWGCQKVSDGCTHCYAETFSKRVGQDIWGPPAVSSRRFFGDKYWSEPLNWNRDAQAAGQRSRVFTASMSDAFEDHPDVGPHRDRLFALIEETPWLTWQVLTKRPENVNRMIPASWHKSPPSNWWQGTSTEDQRTADERIPYLLNTPAAVRFLSCEPLLGPIELKQKWLYKPLCYCCPGGQHVAVDWVIAGGESGVSARPMHPDWARSLRDQCVAAGVAFHFKQWGEYLPAEVRWTPVGDGRFDLNAYHQDGSGPDGHPGRRDYWWTPVRTGTHPGGLGSGLISTRVGKHVAGRLLDGRTWDEFPPDAEL